MALTGTARNIMIAHRDWIQEPGTVLSGAAWMTSLPLANLQNYKLSKVARSASPNQLAPYILVDFGAALRPPVTGIVIPRHNLYQTARWRIRMGADPSFSLATVAYDTRPNSGTTTSLSSIIVAAPQTVTLVVTEALTFFPGVAVVIKSAAAPTAHYLVGTVASYDNNSKTLVVTVSSASGSGTWSNWIVDRQAADITAWPQVIPLGEGVWGAGYTWGGLLKVDPGYRPPVIHMIPLATGNSTPIYQRYLRIDFFDPDNPDGYIDLGKLVVSPVWQPSINIVYGWEIEYVDPSPRVRSRGGQVYVDQRPKFRRLTISLQNISIDEIMTQAFELDRKLGIGLPLTISIFPTNPTHLHRLTIYGSLVQTSPIRHDIYGYSKSYTFEEWL